MFAAALSLALGLIESGAPNVGEFVPISVSHGGHTLQYFVAPDYLAAGFGPHNLLTPVRPEIAQKIADHLDCLLPTPKMVDDIYAAAEVKLAPAPIPPSPAMTTLKVFRDHNRTVAGMRPSAGKGQLVAGHKKDVVITPRLARAPGKVAIYGWHQTNGQPIQPLYLGHTSAWVDYSHGVRFVSRRAILNGQEVRLETVLADPMLSALVSKEGPILTTRYDQISTNQFAERILETRHDSGVRVSINEPKKLDRLGPVKLVLYALPNGNSIEETAGRKAFSTNEWRFEIQHIGAQTRWLRARAGLTNLVVVYLECAEKAWPAWRRKNDPENKRIPQLVEALRQRYQNPAITLTGHSGGGSFTFGHLNGISEIPNDIERIAFLDGNYAYDPAQGHDMKLANWLQASENHFLCVFAYHDSIALLNGKTFVSENGGTWGRSHAMLKDLTAKFSFHDDFDSDLRRHRALGGRVQFLLKENPTKAILHTRQVELNGFIHALLTGTASESNGYSYFGERVYGELIAPPLP